MAFNECLFSPRSYQNDNECEWMKRMRENFNWNTREHNDWSIVDVECTIRKDSLHFKSVGYFSRSRTSIDIMLWIISNNNNVIETTNKGSKAKHIARKRYIRSIRALSHLISCDRSKRMRSYFSKWICFFSLSEWK